MSTETDARGNVKPHTYEHARGLLLGTTYSDGTTARSYQYNHLGQLTQVTDDAGTRTIGYNRYGEQETDSLAAGGVTHLITETRNDMGRSTGYTYAKNGATQQTATTSYGTEDVSALLASCIKAQKSNLATATDPAQTCCRRSPCPAT